MTRFRRRLLPLFATLLVCMTSASLASEPACGPDYAGLRAKAALWSPVGRSAQASDLRRERDLAALGQGEYDVLVIGGGSAGLGAALDAARRGLRVALVEAGDYASETSSRSTKLLHGGVRYLEQLVNTLLKTGKLDRVQYNLIRDALKERKVVLKNAPHLSNPLEIVTPAYGKFELAKYFVGLKAYDLLAGKGSSVGPTRFVSREEVLRRFPGIKQEGLQGGIAYYDGQFNDARLAVSLAQTGEAQGARMVNYARVEGLVREDGPQGPRIRGAQVRDMLGGGTVEVRARVVINATGPFGDQIRRLDDPAAAAMIAGASGTHLILPREVLPGSQGLLIPRTVDGRVLFVLPWQGHTLVGTTDARAAVVSNPRPTEEEISYLLREASKYLEQPLERSQVQSAWTGIRPLVSEPGKHDTAQLARDHVVQVSPAGLVTISGGKWTTYRKMALDVVDHAIRVAGLKPRHPGRSTEDLPLVGALGYRPDLGARLAREYGVAEDVARHLALTYGDRAPEILEIARREGGAARLAPGHPYLEAEVYYAVLAEAARKPLDVLSRRTRLTFLDREAARQALPRVTAIMARLQGWSAERQAAELREAEAAF